MARAAQLVLGCSFSGAAQKAVDLTVPFVLAVASYHFLELPIRNAVRDREPYVRRDRRAPIRALAPRR